MSGERIAIIGSGVTGLGCAWSLVKGSADQKQITLYEADKRLGGHSNTVTFVDKKSNRTVSVDTGFIVYNTLNYPNLTAFFKEENVETTESDMSFGLSVNDGEIEWAGESLDTVFAQRKNLANPNFLRMVWEIVRFGKEAPKVLIQKECETMSVDEYLTKNGYSSTFREYYILPMTSAIWSTPLNGMLEFPIYTLVHFMHNHKMLQISERPKWRTVKGGCINYVNKIKKVLEHHNVDIKLNTPVASVKRNSDGTVEVVDGNGNSEIFNHVVFACHPDTTNQILQDPTPQEKIFIKAFKYSKNRAVLHSDDSFMPKLKSVWSSWNYLMNSKSQIILTYWMNRLQPFIPNDLPLFVTLNPHKQPKDVHAEIFYEHPIYLPECVPAQRRAQEWNNSKDNMNTYYCGAWCGYGFHEDGFISGLQVAERLGAKVPWGTIDLSRYNKDIPNDDSISTELLVFSFLWLFIVVIFTFLL